MPLIALASVKGSPGVTTTCLALAAAWPGQRRLVIEADPARRGSRPVAGPAARTRADRPGRRRPARPQQRRRLAARLRTRRRAEPGHRPGRRGAGQPPAWPPWPGTRARSSPRSPPGRTRSSPTAAGWTRAPRRCAIAAQAEVTLLMVRPRVSELSHLALRADGLSRAGARLALLLAPDAGRGPAEAIYPAEEIASHPGHPGAGQHARRPARRGRPDPPAAANWARSGGCRWPGQRPASPPRWPPDPASPAVPGSRARPRPGPGASSSGGDRR